MDIRIRKDPQVSDIFARQIEALWMATPAEARSYVGRHGWRVRAELIDTDDPGVAMLACVYPDDKAKRIVYYQYCQTVRGRCQTDIDLLVHYHELGHVVREQCRMHAGKLIRAGRGNELCRFQDYQAAFEDDYRRLDVQDIENYSYFLSPRRIETPSYNCDPYEWAQEKIIEESYAELFGEHATQRGGELTELLPCAAAIVRDDMTRILPSLAPTAPVFMPAWPVAKMQMRMQP